MTDVVAERLVVGDHDGVIDCVPVAVIDPVGVAEELGGTIKRSCATTPEPTIE